MTAEELVTQWEKTGVAGVNLDELKALCAENRRLREALADISKQMLLSEMGAEQSEYADYEGAYETMIKVARAALAAEPASVEAMRDHEGRIALHNRILDEEKAKAEDRAQDAMRAQVYPDLWPGPLLGEASAHPPPPTQGEEETARELLTALEAARDGLDAALRQRADEATRAENEACAKIALETAPEVLRSYHTAASACELVAAAIRARIAPKGEP